jgi:hypothetical protein
MADKLIAIRLLFDDGSASDWADNPAGAGEIQTASFTDYVVSELAIADCCSAIRVGLTPKADAPKMQALRVLDAMESNPTAAAALIPQLTAIKNIPPTVMNLVYEASASGTSMAQAKNALLEAANSPNTPWELAPDPQSGQ